MIERFDAPTIIFLTVCTAKKQPVLARESPHTILRSAWLTADAWAVGYYLLMPDHLHLFCAPRRDDVELMEWVHYWKSMATRRWADRTRRTLWQRDFWDTQLRSAISYGEKLDYVRWNPVRRGLVRQPEDWPYQGEMNRLSWL